MSARITIDLSDTAEEAVDRLSSKLHLNTADTFRMALSVLYRREFGEEHFCDPAKLKAPDEPRGNGVAAGRDRQVFTHCNVCGRMLHAVSEMEMGMCGFCAVE